MSDLSDKRFYNDEPGAYERLRDFRNGFPLGERLGTIRFPDDFIDAYTQNDGDVIDFESGREYFAAHWQKTRQVLMLNSIFSPYFIWSQIRIIGGGNSPLEKNKLSPDHCVIGEAYGKIGRPFILVNINPDTEEYGKIYAWYTPGDLLGNDEDPQGLGYVADSLEDFLDSLSLRENIVL